MELFNDPKRLAMLMAGINMMQASRGGNPDMSKGGFGYALGQGLQGGLQGYSTAKQFQGMDAEQEAKDKKQQALDDMLMKLNISPGAMQSQGVMRPGVQQGAQPFQNIPPERKQMAAMALQMGDVGAAMKAMIPDAGSTKGLDAFAPIYVKRGDKLVAGIPAMDPMGKAMFSEIPTGEGEIAREAPGDARWNDVAAKIAAADGAEKATGNVKNWQKMADEGLAIADNYAPITRAKDLLNTIETSGFDAFQLKAKQYFGIDGADEGELSNLLGKSMIAQLRSTFGPQFTEKDREEFAKIEASFSKSPAANYRQLENALKLIERKARRGADAARRSGDDFTAKEIDDALNFRLSDTSKQSKAPAGVPADVWGVMTAEERAAWQ